MHKAWPIPTDVTFRIKIKRYATAAEHWGRPNDSCCFNVDLKFSPFTNTPINERCPVLKSKALRYQHDHSDRSANKASFRLAAKIMPKTGKIDSRYTAARAEKPANGSSICWDGSFTPGSYLQGVQRLSWRQLLSHRPQCQIDHVTLSSKRPCMNAVGQPGS